MLLEAHPVYGIESVTAVKWNSRTLMYDKRSVEKYRRERRPRIKKEAEQ